MTFREYRTRTHIVPYHLDLRSGRGHLTYVGVAHVHDPDDPQLEVIRRTWNESHPTLVFYEGPTHEPRKDPRAAMLDGEGEAALVRSLAMLNGVEVRSFDPGHARQVEGLKARGHAPCDVMLYFVLRQVAGERDGLSPERLVPRTAEIIDYYGQVQGLADCVASVDDLQSTVAQRFGGLDWAEVPNEWFDPAAEDHPWANVLSRHLSELRDEAMVADLCSALAQGHRVFAVAGASHVVMQEPALRSCART